MSLGALANLCQFWPKLPKTVWLNSIKFFFGKIIGLDVLPTSPPPNPEGSLFSGAVFLESPSFHPKWGNQHYYITLTHFSVFEHIKKILWNTPRKKKMVESTVLYASTEQCAQSIHTKSPFHISRFKIHYLQLSGSLLSLKLLEWLGNNLCRSSK